ncbi:Uncharacterised protein [Mycobacteroides abscessus subsp. abscessus]|nr:Uncharacterised protein [Mycobacteroides abscessus subsp. abscessus]
MRANLYRSPGASSERCGYLRGSTMLRPTRTLLPDKYLIWIPMCWWVIRLAR